MFNYNDEDYEYNFNLENSFSDIQKEENESKILQIIEPKIEEQFNWENDFISLKYDLKNIKITKIYEETNKLTKSLEKSLEEKNSEFNVQKNKSEKSENDNSIIEPDFKNIIYNDSNEINELKQNLKPLGKKRGRAGTTGAHNKLSDDNLRRKCKHILLNILFHFINEKINQKYKHFQRFEKRLLVINQKQKADTSVQFNKDFLDKSIGDIFSEKISGKYTNFPPYHNKYIINFLKKAEEKDNNKYFQILFNLSFLDCLKHFRRSTYIKELDGMKDIDFLKDKFSEDKEYLKSLNYYFMNFEDITNNKKTRKNKKKRNIELNKEKDFEE